MKKVLFAVAVASSAVALLADQTLAAGRGGPRGGGRGFSAPGRPGAPGGGTLPIRNDGPGLDRLPGADLDLRGPAGDPDFSRWLDGDRAGDRNAPVERPAATQAPDGWSNGGAKPFTPAWYAQHPNAWKATHPYAGAAAVAVGAAELARWLAVPSVWVGGGSATHSVESAPAGAETTDPSDPAASAAPAAEDPSPSAGQAAADTGWKSIGVFTLTPEGQAQGTRVIQLSVSRQGAVRGSHYDLLSDGVENIRGAVNKRDMRIAWSVGDSGKVVFEAPLGELTKAEGRVIAHLPDGRTAAWQTRPVRE